MSLLNAPRRFLVRARDSLDRKLYPKRRERARERLESLAPGSVLFVCLGNVCRSPYAERLAAKKAKGALTADSAGFIGPGRPPPDYAIQAALGRGLDHADHRSTTLSGDMLEEAGAVFLFDRHNARRLRAAGMFRKDKVFWLGDFDPTWVGRRAIPDPWGKSLEEFEATFERIERCIDALLEALQPSGPPTH